MCVQLGVASTRKSRRISRSVILCDPIVFIYDAVESWKCKKDTFKSFYKHHQKTIKHNLKFVFVLHFVTSSCKIDRSFL